LSTTLQPHSVQAGLLHPLRLLRLFLHGSPDVISSPMPPTTRALVVLAIRKLLLFDSVLEMCGIRHCLTMLEQGFYFLSHSLLIYSIPFSFTGHECWINGLFLKKKNMHGKCVRYDGKRGKISLLRLQILRSLNVGSQNPKVEMEDFL
jgi:hypothetical protein